MPKQNVCNTQIDMCVLPEYVCNPANYSCVQSWNVCNPSNNVCVDSRDACAERGYVCINDTETVCGTNLVCADPANICNQLCIEKLSIFQESGTAGWIVAGLNLALLLRWDCGHTNNINFLIIKALFYS